MRDFKKLEIWQFGFEIARKTFLITETFPKIHQWGMGTQMNKAGVSIPSNVAEGSSRSSEKDYNRFIEISLGSSFELETQLLLSKDAKIGGMQLIDETLELVNREQKMLMSFSRVLHRK